MNNNDIIVMGDIHGEFSKLNSWIASKHPRIILQCGDFGYWPRYTSKKERKRGKPFIPKLHDAKLYWCDGNHEDFDSIKQLNSNEVYPNVFYMERGTTLRLPDGRNVLFIGGAESVDKAWRIEQELIDGDKIWFAEERITQQNISNMPDEHIDIVISHAAPREFEIWGGTHDMLHPDQSRLALSAVLHKYKKQKPLWFFGHYHARIRGAYQGVEYFGLNMIGRSDWWMRLPPSQINTKKKSIL